MTQNLYWINAIVFDDTTDKKPWLCAPYTGHLTLEDAQKELQTLKNTRPLIAAWIDDGAGHTFINECYIDAFGNKSK